MTISIGSVEFNLCKITQLCGQNTLLKNQVFYDLNKYFSSEKMSEEELSRINVRLDGEKIGRKHMVAFSIENRSKLVELINNSKTSLLMKYISMELNELSFQIELSQIEMVLSEIFQEINQKIQIEIGELELDYSASDVFSMIQKSTVVSSSGDMVSYMKNSELFEIWLNLMTAILKKCPEKTLVLLPDFDHLISKGEYKAIMQHIYEATEETDISFVIGTSLNSYVFITESTFSGIAVFNDEFLQFENSNEMCKYVENHYPYLKSWNKDELYDDLADIVHIIGEEHSLFETKQEVLLKLLNQTLMMNVQMRKKGNPAELSFLFE